MGIQHRAPLGRRTRKCHGCQQPIDVNQVLAGEASNCFVQAQVGVWSGFTPMRQHPSVWLSDENEWLTILKGSARLRLADPDVWVDLSVGDQLTLSSGRRHRLRGLIRTGTIGWLSIGRMVQTSLRLHRRLTSQYAPASAMADKPRPTSSCGCHQRMQAEHHFSGHGVRAVTSTNSICTTWRRR